MDMYFYWLHVHKHHQQFKLYWHPNYTNYLDCWSKHHPTTHQAHSYKQFLTQLIIPEMLHMKTIATASA